METVGQWYDCLLFQENFDNRKDLVVSDTELKHVVSIFGCTNSTVTIKGKVNAVVLGNSYIMIDNCKKTAVVVDSVVSSFETVNCKSIQAQILGKAPTALIDKTDGLILYLSKECLDIEIFMAKSSEVNVSIPGKTEKDDFIEKVSMYLFQALPEQLRFVIKDGTLVANVVEHKGQF